VMIEIRFNQKESRRKKKRKKD